MGKKRGKEKINKMPSSRTKRSKTSVQSNLESPEKLEENIVFNCGDENSIYRALEDAGAGIQWKEIREIYDSKTNFSWEDHNIKNFLEKFAKDNNLTINYSYTFGNQILSKNFGDSRKKQQRKIAIRQEKSGGHEFTAVFSTQVMYSRRQN